MYVFYHNDLDGKCSASVLYNKFKDKTIKFQEITYGDVFPFDKIEKNEDVYILDWSLSEDPDGWKKLNEITENVYWIDHHITAITNCKYDYRGIRDVKYAGCVLTYAYLYGINLTTDFEKIPYYIRLIGDHDTWSWMYKETWNFIQGISLIDTDPTSKEWITIKDNIQSICNNGYIISKYFELESKKKLDKIGFFTEFEGYKAIVCNSPMTGSKVFDSIKDPSLLQICYYHNGKKFYISLYSSNKDIHCGNIALKYGGGGHVGAAGFSSNTFPFDKIEKIN